MTHRPTTYTADVLARFQSHDLDTTQRQAIATLRDEFTELAARIVAVAGDREGSLALTALEEAAMWATKSIALHGVAAPANDLDGGPGLSSYQTARDNHPAGKGSGPFPIRDGVMPPEAARLLGGIAVRHTPAEDDDTVDLTVLGARIVQDDLDGVSTLGAYLAELLTTLLTEEEGFDPKRPFGDSGWLSAIDDALHESQTSTAEFYDAIHTALTGEVKP